LVIGALQFTVYINDVHVGINSLSEPIILAYVTGDIISGKNVGDFCAVLKLVVILLF